MNVRAARWIVFVVLLAIAASLAACGESDESTTSSTSAANVEAQDAEAKALARTAVTVVETYATDNAGEYSGVDVGQLKQIDPTLATASLQVEAETQSYAVTADSKSGNRFTIARDRSGTTVYTCAEAGVGGCPASGDWGG